MGADLTMSDGKARYKRKNRFTSIHLVYACQVVSIKYYFQILPLIISTFYNVGSKLDASHIHRKLNTTNNDNFNIFLSQPNTNVSLVSGLLSELFHKPKKAVPKPTGNYKND